MSELEQGEIGEPPAARHRARGCLERYRGLLFFLLIVAVLAAVVIFQTLSAGPRNPLLESLTPAPSPQATATPSPLQVYVSGAVQKPDVYTLPPDSIVKDAILAAGGAAADADLDRINLAYPLGDGQQVYVPRQGEESLPDRLQPASASILQPGVSRVNINTAGQAELESLPGIGPALATRILDYRQTHGPFQSVDEMDNVPGIGDALLAKIRDLVTVD